MERVERERSKERGWDREARRKEKENGEKERCGVKEPGKRM